MLSVFQNIKFAWNYFVLRRHRLPSGGLPERPVLPPELDWHTDPLVGDYVRTKNNTWWSDTLIEGLSYPVRISAVGPRPIHKQITSFERLVHALPHLLASSDLDEAPKDDGWGNRPPPFNFAEAKLEVITLFENGTFALDFDFPGDTPYLLSPLATVSADLKTLSTEWIV